MNHLPIQDKTATTHPTALLAALILIVVAAVIAVHWPALSANAISYDDEMYFADNYLVQNPSVNSAATFLTEVFTPSTVSGYYQPLTMISLMLDYALGGRADNLRPFHRTSLALHVINTALILILLYLLFGSPIVAALAALLFGLHPMTVEPIAWVSERKTPLAAFFTFACLLFYLCYTRTANRKLFIAAVAAFLLALMSKPTAIPLPLLLILLDFWPLRRISIRTLLEKIPFFVLAAAFAAITLISQARAASIGVPGSRAFTQVLLILCHHIIFYLHKIIWPRDFVSWCPYLAPMDISHPMVITGIIGTSLLLLLLIVSIRWTRALLTGWLFFFLAILPTMGVINYNRIGSLASDKFAYLPALGFLLILTWALIRLWKSSATSRKSILPAIIIVAVLILASFQAIQTRAYLTHWRTTETLFRHITAMAPTSSNARFFLANELARQGQTDQAVEQYRIVLTYDPNDADTYNNLGTLFTQTGQSEQAMDYYRLSLRFKPDSGITNYNLATLLMQNNQSDQAIPYYLDSLRIKPHSAETHYNLGSAYYNLNRFDEAAQHWAAALNIRPNYADLHRSLDQLAESLDDAAQAERIFTEILRHTQDSPRIQRNLGFAFARQDELDLAISHWRKALTLNPDLAEVHFNLGQALESQDQIPQAALHYQAAIKLTPQRPELHYRYAFVLARMEQLPKAIQHWRQTTVLDPNHAPAWFALGVAAEEADQTLRAIEYYQTALKADPSLQRPRQKLHRLRPPRPTP